MQTNGPHSLLQYKPEGLRNKIFFLLKRNCNIGQTTLIYWIWDNEILKEEKSRSYSASRSILTNHAF